MPKILEIIIEPEKIYAGSIFKLKVKADLSVTCKQVAQSSLKCRDLRDKKCYEFVLGGEKNAIR